MQNEKCVKDEPHSEFTKEEQQEFLNLLNRITPEQREALKKVLKSFILCRRKLCLPFGTGLFLC